MSSQELRATYEERENAWREMEAALNGVWNELSMLGNLYMESSHDPHSLAKDKETEIWAEEYGLEEYWAEAYAETFLAYREDHGDITRDEFRDLVYSWDEASWNEVTDKPDL